MIPKTTQYESLRKKAMISFSKGDFQTASILFSKCIKLYGKHSYFSKKVHRWFGISLFRLNQSELAIKELLLAYKSKKRGIEKKLVNRLINSYGMKKQATNMLDDFYAFHSIKLNQFTKMRSTFLFTNPFDPDDIFKKIVSSWAYIKFQKPIHSMTISEKLAYFTQAEIKYSFIHTTEKTISTEYFDYKTQNKITPESRCLCGSGLPWQICCGRLKLNVPNINHTPLYVSRETH